jgi:hypothetical protein
MANGTLTPFLAGGPNHHSAVSLSTTADELLSLIESV